MSNKGDCRVAVSFISEGNESSVDECREGIDCRQRDWEIILIKIYNLLAPILIKMSQDVRL